MGLYERLVGEQNPKLSVHALIGFLAEVRRGHLTGADAAAALELTPAEVIEVQALLSRFTGAGALTREEVQDVLLLAEQHRYPGYASAAQVRTRLGV